MEDTVWQMARGNPPHPQRGLFSVYIPKHSKALEPHRKDRRVRYALAAGRYQAVAYSSRGKFNVVITFRDHSPYHSGVISDTYYLELFSFEVEPEMGTSIRGCVRPYRTGNLSEKDRRNSGGYSAYWEPRIEAVTKRALTKTGSA
ncbi:MAG: hypothetical protein JSU72_05505 [Deltaproteobacteria bacterium]|nr:MAG: hypothetical protein JSU72_05505 [Deltaproteobacteria bacterium]